MHSVNQKTNSIFSRVIKNTSIITVGRVVNALCSFAYIPWATESLGLTGWVRNLYDGTVEMEVQGREADIDRMILSLEHGSYIRIDNIIAKGRAIEEEERAFRILD